VSRGYKRRDISIEEINEEPTLALKFYKKPPSDDGVPTERLNVS
jgi:hypothetical protein